MLTISVVNLKTRTAMIVKISVFVICVEAIIYLLLYNLHNRTFNDNLNIKGILRANTKDCLNDVVINWRDDFISRCGHWFIPARLISPSAEIRYNTGYLDLPRALKQIGAAFPYYNLQATVITK